MVTKLQYPDALDIVGIATETGTGPIRSEDSMYLDARHWSPEAAAEARQLQSELGLLQDIQKFEIKVNEYPTLE